MTPEKLFEEKVFSNRSDQTKLWKYRKSQTNWERNNMELDDLIQVGRMHLWAC